MERPVSRLLSLVVICATPAFAQTEPSVLPSPPVPTAPAAPPWIRLTDHAVPQPRPIPTRASNPQSAEVQRRQHLADAARHLEAAGRGELANEIRRSIQVTEEIRRKEQQIEQLRREIGELRRIDRQIGGHDRRQIMIEMCWIEIDGNGRAQEDGIGKLLGRVVGASHTEPRANEERDDRALTPRVVQIDADGAEAIRKLLRDHTHARVLSRPTILTHEGRPAKIQCGAEIPIPVPQNDGEIAMEFCEVGQSAEILPQCDDEGNFQLRIAFSVSEADTERGTTVNGIFVPNIHTHRANVNARVQAGKAGVLVAPTPQGTTRLIFVHPSIVPNDPGSPLPPADHPPEPEVETPRDAVDAEAEG